jgi:hypothetical protein
MNKNIKKLPNTINVPLYFNVDNNNHQENNHITFAKFHTIFIGADDAFESICFKLFFSA